MDTRENGVSDRQKGWDHRFKDERIGVFMRKNVLFVLTILFSVLCIVGGGYVILHDGRGNAGYAVIPMLFALVCMQGYRMIGKNEK